MVAGPHGAGQHVVVGACDGVEGGAATGHETGHDGVELAESERPDLILMDLQLPVIDGLEATRRIKANPDLHPTPVIAVTSYALSGDNEKAMAAGCDSYFSKPVSPRTLLAKINEILGRPVSGKASPGNTSG